MSTKEKDIKVASRNVGQNDYGVLVKTQALETAPTKLTKESKTSKLKVRVNLPIFPDGERRAGPIGRTKGRFSSKKMALTAKRKKKLTKNVSFI